MGSFSTLLNVSLRPSCRLMPLWGAGRCASALHAAALDDPMAAWQVEVELSTPHLRAPPSVIQQSDSICVRGDLSVTASADSVTAGSSLSVAMAAAWLALLLVGVGYTACRRRRGSR